MNTNHTVGHVGWSPDYKNTQKLPAIGELIARRSAAACSPSSDTPETQTKVKRICGNWNNAGDRVQEFVLADFARKLERERDEAREDLEFKEKLCAELTKQLREEQQLHTQTLNERDEARQWESQALVARIQRDEFSKTLGEIREMLCDAMPNENAPTSFMAVKLVKERDEARVLADRLAALLQRERDGYGGQIVDPECDCCDCKRLKPIDEALATWKEVRSES